ncbi:MAG: hypothetical protein KDE53_14490 [Caldilineaceae bacterium]|nr:hypothetical protein [Caldilineaceae bacterium]MCB0124486.1 hypothetical protein [Caldilineaceae bacterium]HRW04999.1 hypothetical protein [Caldilineaceae bacterium]
MNRLSRPTARKIAASLAILSALFTFWLFGPLLAQGEAVTEAPPYAVILGGIMLNVIGFVAAYGLWQNQRWGVILTILINALGILLATPGLLFAPTLTLQLSALAGILFCGVIIFLCLWREKR